MDRRNAEEEAAWHAHFMREILPRPTVYDQFKKPILPGALRDETHPFHTIALKFKRRQKTINGLLRSAKRKKT